MPNNDGCVIARSNEAKALGIEMGAPWHLNRATFEREGVIVRSSNYTLYGDMSARVMQVLAGFAPELEIYSIDEAFIGLAGMGGRAEGHMREARATVLQWTGIPVSVGIAPSKTLAKVANRIAKKSPQSSGVLSLMDEASQTEALQLRDSDPKWIRGHFSVVMERMVLELQGVPCVGLEDGTPDRKSIMASRSFGRPVETLAEMEEAVATYVSRAAEKMRRQDLVTPALQVFVNTNRFREGDAQYYGQHTVRLPVATADTTRLIRAALHGLGCIWKTGHRYKKAGVVCLDLHPADRVQAGLFHQPDSPERRVLMTSLDGLNRRYGRGTVAFAASGVRKAWALRSDQRSPAYTTQWDELLPV